MYLKDKLFIALNLDMAASSVGLPGLDHQALSSGPELAPFRDYSARRGRICGAVFISPGTG